MLVIAILRIISIWPVWIWIKSHRDRTLFTSTKDLFNLIRVSNADTATIYVPINTPDPDESRFAESLKVSIITKASSWTNKNRIAIKASWLVA